MSPTKPSGEIPSVDFMSGQIHALTTFAHVVAKLHPRRQLLAQHFEMATQVGLAKIEALPVSDDAVAGFQFVCDRLQREFEPSNS